MTAVYFHDAGTVKIFNGGNTYENRDPYDYVISVCWLDTKTVLFRHAKGSDGTIDNIDEVIEAVKKFGATTFHAQRPKKHRLPRPWKRIEVGDVEDTWELVT